MLVNNLYVSSKELRTINSSFKNLFDFKMFVGGDDKNHYKFSMNINFTEKVSAPRIAKSFHKYKVSSHKNKTESQSYQSFMKHALNRKYLTKKLFTLIPEKT